MFKFTVPRSKENSKDILAMGYFVWQLDNQLTSTADIVQQMKQEHDDYEVQRMIDSDLDRASLKSLIDMKIKRPVRGAKYSILLPTEKDEDEEDVCFVKP
ncbi:hypothetical protein RMATCC62417_10799 [Rhizopus microsporus]|nr:hypothetical protein RMATCC62417_10799 [Rhizopus microsporus]